MVWLLSSSALISVTCSYYSWGIGSVPLHSLFYASLISSVSWGISFLPAQTDCRLPGWGGSGPTYARHTRFPSCQGKPDLCLLLGCRSEQSCTQGFIVTKHRPRRASFTLLPSQISHRLEVTWGDGHSEATLGTGVGSRLCSEKRSKNS